MTAALASLRAGMAQTFAAFDAASAGVVASAIEGRGEIRALHGLPPLRLVEPEEDLAADAAVTAPEPGQPCRVCRECGAGFAPKRPNQLFCVAACGAAFNSRRANRGALLLDLFMTLRYERGFAAAKKVWRAMCRLAETWRREDLEQRDGRKSWSDAGELLAQRPYLSVERGPRTRGGR